MTARTTTSGSHPAADPSTVAFSSLIQVDVSALSHTGHRRANNEDHFLVAKVGRSLDTISTSLSPGDVPTHAEEVNHVMVVADGMGGHAAGEVASRLAISTLIRLALELPDWILRVDEGYARQIAQRSKQRLQKISAMLIKQGEKDSSLKGMGTTLTVARSMGRDLVITHVGDSRAYLLRAGKLHHLTRDHTYAQLLVDIGELKPDELPTSRHRHVLTNALGGSTEDVQVDTDRIPLDDRDRVLLCSDGLTDLVDDEAITRILSNASNAREACEQLVQTALDAGGRDNVTVIVAAYRFP